VTGKKQGKSLIGFGKKLQLHLLQKERRATVNKEQLLAIIFGAY
jgi:hypothetical protein